MEYLFIDESGSMTNNYLNKYPYFVICIVHVISKDKLKTILKRYISKKINAWKEEESRIINNGTFKELKGSLLSYIDKIDLACYLMENNYFELYYIIVNNKNINDLFYSNKARAFNYLLDEALDYNFKVGNLLYDDYFIQIDERNIKNNSLKSLEDYLATNFILKENYINSLIVEYFDSKDNILIQVADFFSNLYYSFLMHKSAYIDVIIKLRKKGIIKNEFIFPLK